MTDDDEGAAHEPTGEGEEASYGAESLLGLSSQATESLSRTIESIRRKLASFEFGVPPIAIKVPDSALKGLASIPGLTNVHQLAMQSALQPVLEAQAAWRQSLEAVNSDIFKSQALVQSNLDHIASQLIKNMDLGFSESMARIGEQIAAHQASMLKAIAPSLLAFRTAFYPPNLQAIDGVRFEEVEQVVMVDGIALYAIPGASTAAALIRADGARARRDVLGRRWRAISADCRTATEACRSSAVAPYVPFALSAIDALEAGHERAAQALVGSLVDAILSSYFGADKSRYTPHPQGKRSKEAYEEFSIREFIAFAPMWQAYQHFFLRNGDKVPGTFSRHATAHTVSPRQFNRRNAVQGLMFACSLLVRLDEEALLSEGGDAAS